MRSALVILLALAILTPSQNADGADAALIEAARKEGKVVWYTTLIVNQAIRPLKAAFEKKYPGIELQYARADETPTAAKILEEGVAGRVQADIFDGITNMIPLKRARLLASYVPAAASQYPPELKDREGYWNALLLYVFTPGINTTLVPKERAPRTYQDLLDPQWKGKDGLEPQLDRGRDRVRRQHSHQHGRRARHRLPEGACGTEDRQRRGVRARNSGSGHRRRIRHRADVVQPSHRHQRAERCAVRLAQARAGPCRVRRRRHSQGRAASERGPAVDRISDVRRRTTGLAEGRLSVRP